MAKREFKTNNLVIICEGTETEYPYFEYIKNKVKDNFVDIKVILNPDDKEKLDKLRESENRKLKKLAYQTNKAPKKYPLYVTLEENEDDVDVACNKNMVVGRRDTVQTCASKLNFALMAFIDNRTFQRNQANKK